jgi:biotin carboxylase
LVATTTTYKAAAFLEAAARLGVDVTVATERAQALAALHPAGHLRLDFASPERAVEAVRAFAAQHPVDAVLAADDEGTYLAALAGRALGLRHNPPEAVLAARDKRRTRAALQARGLPTPWFRTVPLDGDPAAIARHLAYPCVLKPLAASASRGVMRADDAPEFVQRFERLAALVEDARLAGEEILVEAYLPGIEVALEGRLEDGDLHVLALFDKPDPLEGPYFEETIYVTPSRHAPRVQEALAAMAQQACTALGLRHGPVHAELRWNDAGAWLLEVAPRSIGGLCAHALRFGDGSVSLEELLLRDALGRDASLARVAYASGVMMVPIPHAGILRGVRGTEAAAAVAGIHAVRMVIPPGQTVAPPPEGSRYLGFLFAHAATAAEAEAALRAAHAKLEIDIEPSHSTRAGERHARVHG